MCEFVDRIESMSFLDPNDIDALTPEGDMPGECRVRDRLSTTVSVKKVEVAKKRRLNRKKKAQKALAEKWAHVDPFLGTMSDPDVGRKFKVPAATITTRRLSLGISAYSPPSKLPWEKIIPRLGKEPDNALAKEFGAYSGTLKRKRDELGIRAYTSPSRFPWEEIVPLMGWVSDKELAERYGPSVETIRVRRNKLGIPASTKHRVHGGQKKS